MHKDFFFFFPEGLLLDLFQLPGFPIEHVFGQTPQLLHRFSLQLYIFDLPHRDGSKNFYDVLFHDKKCRHIYSAVRDGLGLFSQRCVINRARVAVKRCCHSSERVFRFLRVCWRCSYSNSHPHLELLLSNEDHHFLCLYEWNS